LTSKGYLMLLPQ